MQISEIAEDIFLFTDEESEYFGHVTVLMTKDGPILVDVFRDAYQFKYIEDFFMERGFKCPAAIIYTHWHSDHVCGNRTYTDGKVIASEYTKDHIQDLIDNHMGRLKLRGILEPDVMPVLPNMTFRDRLELFIGGRELLLVHCPGHTYDSILIYDKKTETLIAGDNIVGAEVHFLLPPPIPPDQVDSKPEYYVEAYKAIESFSPKLLVPGHGTMQSPAEMLKENRRRYEWCLKKGLKFCE